MLIRNQKVVLLAIALFVVTGTISNGAVQSLQDSKMMEITGGVCYLCVPLLPGPDCSVEIDPWDEVPAHYMLKCIFGSEDPFGECAKEWKHDYCGEKRVTAYNPDTYCSHDDTPPADCEEHSRQCIKVAKGRCETVAGWPFYCGCVEYGPRYWKGTSHYVTGELCD